MNKGLPIALCGTLVFGLWACSDTPVVSDTEPVQHEELAVVEPPPVELPNEALVVDTFPELELLDGNGQADTPEALFHLMKRAALSKDYGVIFDLLSASGQEQFSKFKNKVAGIMKFSLASAKQEDRARLEFQQQAQLKQMFGVSSADELEAMSPREFYVTMTTHAAKSRDSLGEYADSTLERCEYHEGNESATLIILNPEGEEDQVAVILEGGSWKVNFLGPMTGR